jgi:hypothetical protein
MTVTCPATPQKLRPKPRILTPYALRPWTNCLHLSVMAVTFYRDSAEEYFGNFAKALFTLFQFSTGAARTLNPTAATLPPPPSPLFLTPYALRPTPYILYPKASLTCNACTL